MQNKPKLFLFYCFFLLKVSFLLVILYPLHSKTLKAIEPELLPPSLQIIIQSINIYMEVWGSRTLINMLRFQRTGAYSVMICWFGLILGAGSVTGPSGDQASQIPHAWRAVQCSHWVLAFYMQSSKHSSKEMEPSLAPSCLHVKTTAKISIGTHLGKI